MFLAALGNPALPMHFPFPPFLMSNQNGISCVAPAGPLCPQVLREALMNGVIGLVLQFSFNMSKTPGHPSGGGLPTSAMAGVLCTCESHLRLLYGDNVLVAHGPGQFLISEEFCYSVVSSLVLTAPVTGGRSLSSVEYTTVWGDLDVGYVAVQQEKP